MPLDEAYDPNTAIQPSQPGGPGGEQPAGYATASLAKITATPQGTQVTAITTLYVATPALLSYYGINDEQIGPNRDLISSRSDVAGFQIFNPGAGPGPSPNRPTRPPEATHPKIQTFHQLPEYTSDPQTLITDQAMRALGLRPISSGWLVQAPHSLTSSQIAAARHTAAAAGLYVETRQAQKSLAPLRNWSTAAGILLALGVLAVTVGLIRSETANDVRTLTATGASSTTRRTLTGATAGALALLGALLGTAGAYAALLAWHRSDLGPLARIPAVNLVLLIIGLPAIATVAGWLLAGREPPAINRRPLE